MEKTHHWWNTQSLAANPRTCRNYIDGRFEPAPQDMIEVSNPANGKILGHIPGSTGAEVDKAVAAARRAQPDWELRTATERAGVLRQIAAKVRDNAEDLAAIIVQEQGKVSALAQVEVNFTADYLDYMAEWARRIEGEVITSDRPKETMLLTRKPIGVVGAILPWNFPFFLIARKLAPALVTGNTVVMKPSELTPLNAFAFADLVAELDLPPGVFNLVGGDGGGCGHAIASHPDVDMVSFTGSVPTGQRIMQAAAANLTRVNLELGGKAPAIVLADADLDLAARAIHQSRVINTGQVCNCAERVYVEREVHDALVEKLSTLMANTTYGDPSEKDDLDMGPLVTADAVTRISGVVDAAARRGARIVVGGKRDTSLPGNHFQPTLLTQVPDDAEVMVSETFGPVLPVRAVDSLDEAIALANDTQYGLTSSIYTTNVNSVMKACRELRFGETYVNRENFEAMQGFHAGRKKSGIGGADGKHGLYQYMETHTVYLQET
ncbi:aldehyde dehydrogenase [Nitratireductor aquibiodomus]|uniref:aldehyde dehydrogenase n=1 Tax=Nitratireductor aquibiodomus TaxID=204799 RepID=UPI0019D4023F|nr:aldehyde dehydrogenase [Nitratireductor aquibiodomus]MBN7761581.1 aldehyde dehydrogenase [Nitratireductor aquibiodomus]